MPNPKTLERLRGSIARIERATLDPVDILPFGIPEIDAALPGGGLPVAALHEVSGTGIDLEFAAAPALFAAGILARRPGPVLWVLQQTDLFAPALAAAGLHPDRVIYAEAGHADALLAMEEGLRHPGLASVVAEVSAPVSLTVSRRLHLAAQAGGAIALLLRRRADAEGALAAVTRWRIGPQPSAPPLPHAPETPGLGRLCWHLELTRCRGGRTGSWMVEACDASGCLGLVSPLADRSAAPASFEAAG
ncbi:MAG: ImuA family protein [Janthinobacterium lividum]